MCRLWICRIWRLRWYVSIDFVAVSGGVVFVCYRGNCDMVEGLTFRTDTSRPARV